MTAASRSKISSIDAVTFITPSGLILHTYARDDANFTDSFLLNLEEFRVPNVEFLIRLEGKDTGN